MQLNRTLANLIVGKAGAILKRDMAICDLTGQLIAGGGDTKRVFIAAALNVGQTGQAASGTLDNRNMNWWPFIYDGKAIAVFGLPTDGDALTGEGVMLLEGLAEVIVYQHFLLDKMQSAEHVKANFIKKVLCDPAIDANDIYHQADILQLPLRAPQAVILIKIGDLENSTRDKNVNVSPEEQQLIINEITNKISDSIRVSFKNHQLNIVAYIGDNCFVVLKNIGGEGQTTLNSIRFMSEKGTYLSSLVSKLNPQLATTVGIGQFYPNLNGVRKSYQDAKLALEVGSKVWGNGGAYHIKRVGMFITLAGTTQERKAELAHQILSPLLGDDSLFKTVQAFLASGLNLTEAAEALHVHRNTLIYRLDKTKKLIGLDPRHFDDALQIKLGLMFYHDAEPVE